MILNPHLPVWLGRLRKEAQPYLETRHNLIHTRIAFGFAYRLLSREHGSPAVVLPAILLHDIGWSLIPEDMQLQAFGPRATHPEINRQHEVGGVRLARRILAQIGYPSHYHTRILNIIAGHDSRLRPISASDRLVKDADKLWRYSRQGFEIDVARFGETPREGWARLESHLGSWFLTITARVLARRELRRRRHEILARPD